MEGSEKFLQFLDWSLFAALAGFRKIMVKKARSAYNVRWEIFLGRKNSKRMEGWRSKRPRRDRAKKLPYGEVCAFVYVSGIIFRTYRYLFLAPRPGTNTAKRVLYSASAKN